MIRGFKFASRHPDRWLAIAMALSVVVIAQCGRDKPDGLYADGTRGQPAAPGSTGGSAGPIVPGSAGRAAIGAGGTTIAGGGGAAGSSDACAMVSGTGGFAVGRSGSTPNFTTLPTATIPPPPVSGGTLIVLRNGITAVASDPDRDLIYVVDLSDVTAPALLRTIALGRGSQPGRLVQDAAGLVHVVLRNAGALVSVDTATGSIVMQRSLCALPRGLAYESAKDRLHVACAGGELVTLTPTGDKPERTLKLDQDLRDVVVDGARLMVTRFRSAEVLVVDGAGSIVERIRPPVLTDPVVHSGSPFEPSVAWRAVAMPGGGAAMVHQRGMKGSIDRRPGGYGGPGCDAIVHTAVTVVRSGETPVAGPAMAAFVLPVDLALSGDGQRVAMVAAGNGRAGSGGRRLFVTNVADVALEWKGCGSDGKHGPPGRSCSGVVIGAGSRGGTASGAGGVGGATGAAGRGGTVAPSTTTSAMCNELPNGVEPTAVAFVGADTVVVQTREPAQLWIVQQVNAATTGTQVPVPFALSLSADNRADIGHAVFHSNSGGGLACASCHPEGHEDGRVWNFQCEGERRTQDVGGGISGTEPFHWNGDMTTFGKLVETVFVGRMSGPSLTADQTAAALTWINSIPARPTARAATDPQVERGRAIFADPMVACATCHAGSLLTSNTTVDVGTSRAFQVPSLRGVGWRGPYMHNGCAQDLVARFDTGMCGGGDAHGKTSHLTSAQLGDLIAYLESL